MCVAVHDPSLAHFLVCSMCSWSPGFVLACKVTKQIGGLALNCVIVKELTLEKDDDQIQSGLFNTTLRRIPNPTLYV